MFALISPNELTLTGFRVAEISQHIFEVAPPLFWVACENDALQDKCFYDPVTETIIEIPKPAPNTFVINGGGLR